MKVTKSNQNIIRAIIGVSLFAASFSLLVVARRSLYFADWYSKMIYPSIVATAGRFFGIFPFSASEIIIAILLLFYGVDIGRALYRCVCKREGWRTLNGTLSRFVLGAGVLFFIYTVNCGINYERASFSESTNLQVETYDVSDIKEVCLWLTEKLNRSSALVDRDNNGVMKLYEGEKEAAVDAMRILGNEYSEMEGYYPKPKGLINSWILSIQNLAGIYLPFTVEANYNQAMVPYNIPFTVCHELSHLRGFMQEEEANFIAWLACEKSERSDFNYSADLLGWIYCTNVLKQVDSEGYKEVRGKLAPSVQVDLAANSEFWEKYDTAISEVSNKINDTYLKANGQQEGVKSYDRMVDLLVSYYMNNY